MKNRYKRKMVVDAEGTPKLLNSQPVPGESCKNSRGYNGSCHAVYIGGKRFELRAFARGFENNEKLWKL